MRVSSRKIGSIYRVKTHEPCSAGAYDSENGTLRQYGLVHTYNGEGPFIQLEAAWDGRRYTFSLTEDEARNLAKDIDRALLQYCDRQAK